MLLIYKHPGKKIKRKERENKSQVNYRVKERISFL
jgi:hypothetical protein